MSRPPPSKSRGDKAGSRGTAAVQNVAAAVSNDILPGRLSEAEWLRLIAEDEKTSFLGSIIDEIIENTLEKCYEKYIESQLIPFTVDHAKNSILQIVEWHFLNRDIGEVNIANDEGWKEDSEPEAAAIDSWAQGSVPVVVRPQSSLAASVSVNSGHTYVAEPTELPDITEDDVVSFPTETGITDDQQIVNEGSSQKLPKAKTKKQSPRIKVKPPDEIQYNKTSNELKKRRKRTYKKHTGRLPPLPSSDFNAVAAVQDQANNIDAEKDSKTGMHLSPSQKSLIKSQAGRPPGNREVTFDERGNVIGVMKLNVQTLPTHRVRVHYSIIDPVAEANSKKLTGFHFLRSQKTTRSDRKSDKVTETTKSYTTEKTLSHIKSEYSSSSKMKETGRSVSHLAASRSIARSIRSIGRDRKVIGSRIDPLPPLLIDTIDASPGVIIQEGDQVKRGPEEKYSHIVSGSLHRRHPEHQEPVLRLLSDKIALNKLRPIINPNDVVQIVKGTNNNQSVFAVTPGLSPLTVKTTAET